MGVHSLSTGKPIKTAGAIAQGPDFGAAETYADWKFVYLPGALPAPEAGAAPPPGETSSLPSLLPVPAMGLAPAK